MSENLVPASERTDRDGDQRHIRLQFCGLLTRATMQSPQPMLRTVPVLSHENAITHGCNLPRVDVSPPEGDPVLRGCCEELETRRKVSGYESDCIQCLIRRNKPFFLGRTGMGHESWTACLAATNNWNTTYWPIIRRHLTYKNGVPTANTSDAMEFGRCYAAAVNASDLMVRWGARSMPHLREGGHGKAGIRGASRGGRCGGRWTDTFLKSDILLEQSGHWPRRALSEEVVQEPYRLDLNVTWLSALANRTVLIVHPFNESIQKQLGLRSATDDYVSVAAGRREAIWGDWGRTLMPSGMRLKIVVPPVSFAGADEYKNWRPALAALLARVDAAGPFDVALLSCGGLGMPLGAYLRRTGRSSIYIGGSLQIWFGIIGNRWRGWKKSNPFLRKTLNNSNWVSPLPSERPPGYKTEENSAYWR